MAKDTSRLQDKVATPFDALNKVIEGGGFPPRRCSAIVGSRGGMKSHLAYYTLLSFLRRNPRERALIISLRDPEEAARDTLSQIVQRQRDDRGKAFAAGLASGSSAEEFIEEYLAKDRLEILFFWPGYISPEEFFHLVVVAVDRAPRGQKQASLVVVNGLEQLSARFPLCEKESMFVSGLTTLLTAKGTANIVVSAGNPTKGPGEGGVPAGLMPMADLILESSFTLLPTDQVWSEAIWPQGKQWRSVLGQKGARGGEEAHVVYQVIREPGARECRKRVLFYMGRDGDPPPLYPGSVVVRSLPDEFPQGRRL